MVRHAWETVIEVAQADGTNLGDHAYRVGPVRGDVSEEKEAQRVPGQGLRLEFVSWMGTTKRGEVVPRSTPGRPQCADIWEPDSATAKCGTVSRDQQRRVRWAVLWRVM
jgi:hypothetical protein